MGITDIPALPEPDEKLTYKMRLYMWVVALVNALIAVVAATFFAPTAFHAFGAGIMAFILSYLAVRLLIYGAWLEAVERHNKKVGELDEIIKNSTSIKTGRDAERKVMVANLELLKLNPPRKVSDDGFGPQVSTVTPENALYIMSQIEKAIQAQGYKLPSTGSGG